MGMTTDPIDANVERVPIDFDPVRGALVCLVQPPPVLTPVRLDDAPDDDVVGRRVVWQSRQHLWHFDVRVTRGPYVSPSDGELLVNIAAEVDWYRSKLMGAPLRERAVVARNVFLERPAASQAP